MKTGRNSNQAPKRCRDGRGRDKKSQQLRHFRPHSEWGRTGLCDMSGGLIPLGNKTFGYYITPFPRITALF